MPANTTAAPASPRRPPYPLDACLPVLYNRGPTDPPSLTDPLYRLSEKQVSMPTYVRVGEYARKHGVSVSTVRRWDAEGRITGQRSHSGQRLYDLDVEPAPIERKPTATPSLRTANVRVVDDGDEPHDVPEWERVVHMARSRYEVEKIEAEREDLLRQREEEMEARDRGASRRRCRPPTIGSVCESARRVGRPIPGCPRQLRRRFALLAGPTNFRSAAQLCLRYGSHRQRPGNRLRKATC